VRLAISFSELFEDDGSFVAWSDQRPFFVSFSDYVHTIGGPESQKLDALVRQ